MLPYMIAGVVSLVIFLGITKVSSSAGDRKIVKKRLEGLADDDTSDFDEGEKTASAESMEKLMGSLGVRPSEDTSATRKALNQAGIFSSSATVYYAFAKSLGWIGGIAIGGLLVLTALDRTGMIKGALLLAAFLAFVIFSFGAQIWLSNTRQKRMKVLQRSFPDALDLLLVCVESGLALDAALARVCRELGEAHPEITKELNKTRMDLTLLGDREAALNDLAERTGMPAFKALVVALVQSEKFGTSLSDTLRVLADDYRQERLMIAEDKAGRLPSLMTIPMMIFMLPALMLIIIGPAAIKLIANFGGS